MKENVQVSEDFVWRVKWRNQSEDSGGRIIEEIMFLDTSASFGWDNTEMFNTPDDMLCVLVGYYDGEDESAVYLFQAVSATGTLFNRIAIPKGSIVKRTRGEFDEDKEFISSNNINP